MEIVPPSPATTTDPPPPGNSRWRASRGGGGGGGGGGGTDRAPYLLPRVIAELPPRRCPHLKLMLYEIPNGNRWLNGFGRNGEIDLGS